MKINYPTYKIDLGPTPSDTLWVCPTCGDARWSWANHTLPLVCHHCQGRKGGPVRMRLATADETATGKSKLETTIGGREYGGRLAGGKDQHHKHDRRTK